MWRTLTTALVILWLSTLLFPPGTQAQAPSSQLIARGKYIFVAAGGCACHTSPASEGKQNGGGKKIEGPFGIVYTPNITPDKETGIGQWSQEAIINAIRRGVRPTGGKMHPVMPYPYYSFMAMEDLRALVAYLMTFPPVRNQVPPSQLRVAVPDLVIPDPPEKAPRSGIVRGRYLVDAVSACVDCHTGKTTRHRYLAGTLSGPEDTIVPNITPDPSTGISRWTKTQIIAYLQTGERPDGRRANRIMMEVIRGRSGGYGNMTRQDLTAIADYLRTIPPIQLAPQ